MTDHDLCFSSKSTSEAGSYKLIELPAELCKIVESSFEGGFSPRFTVKGQRGEDAVLCTSNATYAMRSVLLSNSLLVVTPPVASDFDFDDNKLAIRDQISQFIELTVVVPKLHKLAFMLKGSEYDETSAEEDMDADAEHSRDRIFEDDIRKAMQASDAELDRGLRERRILNINRELRPIAPQYLKSILEMILTRLVADSIPHERAGVQQLSSGLADDHEVPRSVSTQVMTWFGNIQNGFWNMDVEGIVRQVGLSILRPFSNKRIDREEFLSTWKTAVGDTFEDRVALDLLAGNYLIEKDDALSYFPSSSLSAEPAKRFADLFLVRPRWKGDVIAPFLADIAVDSKERDKLLLKYARAITDPQGIWYTSRAQYTG